MKYSLLIVEDHALTRFGLRTAFEAGKNFSEILEAPDAKTALNLVKKKSFDAVIMDLGLPDMSGLDAAKIIKEKHPPTKIIILSSHEKEEDVIKSLRAGASAYCTKDIAPEKLIETTESVLEGAAWFDPKVAQYVLNLAGQSSLQEALGSNAGTQDNYYAGFEQASDGGKYDRAVGSGKTAGAAGSSKYDKTAGGEQVRAVGGGKTTGAAGSSKYDKTAGGEQVRAAGSGKPAKTAAANTGFEKINLTARERQVLALIAEGMSNNEIARTLEVSINTTKAHVCSILQKLGVNDRTQAAIKAYKENLI